MKNLLIRKSFSYEIVDFTLLRQSNTYHLGGGRSIHLSYGNVYKIVCDLRLLLLQKVSVAGEARIISILLMERPLNSHLTEIFYHFSSKCTRP